MTYKNPQIAAAVADLRKYQDKGAELQRRAEALQAVVAKRAEAQSRLDALDANDARAMSEWSANGCDGEPKLVDDKTREAARKSLFLEDRRAAAAEAALRSLHGEQLALSADMEGANTRLAMAVAQHLTEVRANILTRARELHDQLDAHTLVASMLYQQAIARHAHIAGQGADAADKDRVTWENGRQAAIDAAAREMWAEIAATFPA